MTAPFRAFDPLLPEAEAHQIERPCERFGSHGLYSEEALNEGIGEGLPQRFDAAFAFVRTGGRFARNEDLRTLAARTSYFREAYAYVSWKAYCFRDEEERRLRRECRDDLSLDPILTTLEEDLRRRVRLEGPRPDNRSFAEHLVGEYVRFPTPTPTPLAA